MNTQTPSQSQKQARIPTIAYRFERDQHPFFGIKEDALFQALFDPDLLWMQCVDDNEITLLQLLSKRMLVKPEDEKWLFEILHATLEFNITREKLAHYREIFIQKMFLRIEEQDPEKWFQGMLQHLAFIKGVKNETPPHSGVF